MARVTITISDEVPGQALSVSMEFTPSVTLASGRDTNSKQFIEDNPPTHVAAYYAYAAIDEFMGTEPSVTTFSHSSDIVI